MDVSPLLHQELVPQSEFILFWLSWDYLTLTLLDNLYHEACYYEPWAHPCERDRVVN